MQSERVVQSVMSLFAVMVTAWFLFAAAPEQGFVQSSDRVVTVVGAGAAAKTWDIERFGTPLGAPLTGYAYQLLPSGQQPQPVTLGILAEGSRVLYRLNQEMNAWEVVPEGQAIAAGLTAPITQFATYAVGQELTVTPPTFVSDLEELQKERPPNAIGADLFIAVAEPGGPSIVMPQATQRLMCDGVTKNYNDVAYSRRTRMIEGRRYDLILRWLIGAEECVSGVLK